jgi:hypothetical protein
MPFLDANALKSDRKGLAFLREVLGLRAPRKPAAAPKGAPEGGERAPPQADATPR